MISKRHLFGLFSLLMALLSCFALVLWFLQRSAPVDSGPEQPTPQPQTAASTVPIDPAPATESDPSLEADHKALVSILIHEGTSERFVQRKAPTRAAAWKTGAERGQAIAQHLWARCLLDGVGVQRDVNAAVRWYRLAAKQNYPPALNSIGFLYMEGEGAPENPFEAARWFRCGAELGFAPAQNNLGEMYLNGTGVELNEAEALKWIRRAAEQEDVRAQFNLGEMYENGTGVEESTKEAVRWYRLAARQKYNDAIDALHRLGQSADRPSETNEAR